MEVEKRLQTGRPCGEVAKDLKGLGFTVTKTQLLTHYTQHMPQEEADLLEESAPPLAIIEARIDVEKALRDLEEDLLRRDYRKNTVHTRLKTAALLETLVLKHLVAANVLMDTFCDGLGPYPQDVVRGLKTVLHLLDDLPNYADKTILYEIDRVSEKARKLDA